MSSSLLPGNSVTVTYTDPSSVQHTVTIESLGAGGSLPLQTSPPGSNNQMIGVDFSGGMSSVVTQLNAAFGSDLQFSNPSGTVLQVLNQRRRQRGQCAVGDVDRDFAHRAAARRFRCLPTEPSRSPARSQPAARRPPGLPARIAVNPALVASPSSLVALRSEYVKRRSNAAEFHPQPADQCLADLLAGHRHRQLRQTPYSGTLTDYLSQVVSQQSQAANAATNLQQGQDTVVSALATAVQRSRPASISTPKCRI